MSNDKFCGVLDPVYRTLFQFCKFVARARGDAPTVEGIEKLQEWLGWIEPQDEDAGDR